MAHAGQSITNAVSGERITFIRTSADTDGELLEFELELTPEKGAKGEGVVGVVAPPSAPAPPRPR